MKKVMRTCLTDIIFEHNKFPFSEFASLDDEVNNIKKYNEAQSNWIEENFKLAPLTDDDDL